MQRPQSIDYSAVVSGASGSALLALSVSGNDEL
jgi:hypothetical protein